MKLALGTVQFGLDYGINNTRGKIPEHEVKEILITAAQNGITLLDTASAYGDSEALLGKFASKDFKIVTKLGKDDIWNLQQAFTNSLQRLQRESIYACLFHHFDEIKNDPSLWEEMQQLKKQQKVQKIGFSLYSPKELEWIFEHNLDFDILQIPFNIFDQRFQPYLSRLKQKGVEVHVRSVFLQGLFFKPPSSLSEFFLPIKPKVNTIHSLAKDSGLTVAGLCIAFVSHYQEIDSLVLGVDSIENLCENIAATNISLTQEQFAQLQSLKEDSEKIIIPSNWKTC